MDVNAVALLKRMVGIGLGVTLCWCRRIDNASEAGIHNWY
jgi:hypothetical protein